MKSIYKYLLLTILLPIWLIPAGQLALYKHICNSSQTINYTQSLDENCCGGSCGISLAEAQNSCCVAPLKIEKEACCEYEAVELATIFLHIHQEKDNRFTVFQMSCPPACEHCSIVVNEGSTALISFSEEIPPHVYGKQWLIEHKQLKIAHIA